MYVKVSSSLNYACEILLIKMAVIDVLLAMITDLVWLYNTLGLMPKSHRHNILHLSFSHKVFDNLFIRPLLKKIVQVNASLLMIYYNHSLMLSYDTNLIY